MGLILGSGGKGGRRGRRALNAEINVTPFVDVMLVLLIVFMITAPLLVRGEEVMIAHSHLTVESEDHLILFLVDKSKIKLVEKLFSVGFTFF